MRGRKPRFSSMLPHHNFCSDGILLEPHTISQVPLQSPFIESTTTGIARFADSLKLSAKPLILSAKGFPTGFRCSCRRSPVGKNPVGKDLFPDRNTGVVGVGSPTATCSVGEGTAPSTRLPFASPTAPDSCRRTLCRQPLIPVGDVFADSYGRLSAKPRQ